MTKATKIYGFGQIKCKFGSKRVIIHGWGGADLKHVLFICLQELYYHN